MRMYHLDYSVLLPIPIDRVFPFFADALNLARITLPWLNFQGRTPAPIAMHECTLIDYTIKWMGIPIRWQTQIDAYDHPQKFVDRQVKGPYALWRHTHTFAPEKPGTRMKDHVEYQIGYGPLGNLANWLLIRKQLKEIFDYRQRQIGTRLKPAWQSCGMI